MCKRQKKKTFHFITLSQEQLKVQFQYIFEERLDLWKKIFKFENGLCNLPYVKIIIKIYWNWPKISLKICPLNVDLLFLQCYIALWSKDCHCGKKQSRNVKTLGAMVSSWLQGIEQSDLCQSIWYKISYHCTHNLSVIYISTLVALLFATLIYFCQKNE